MFQLQPVTMSLICLSQALATEALLSNERQGSNPAAPKASVLVADAIAVRR